LFRFSLNRPWCIAVRHPWLTGFASRERPLDVRKRSRNHQLNYRSAFVPF